MKIDTRFNESFESFSDVNFFYPLARTLLPIFKKLNISPNMITTLSLIAIFNAFLKINKNKKEAIISYFVGYLLDCADGMMARKYNMGSNFGMAYDMVTDTVSNFFILYIFLSKDNLPMEMKVMLIVATLFLMLLNGINEAYCCQRDNGHDNFYEHKKEILKNNKSFIINLYLKIEESNYKTFKKFMPKYDEQKIKSYAKKLRLIGAGNYCLFIIFLMNKYF